MNDVRAVKAPPPPAGRVGTKAEVPFTYEGLSQKSYVRFLEPVCASAAGASSRRAARRSTTAGLPVVPMRREVLGSPPSSNDFPLAVSDLAHRDTLQSVAPRVVVCGAPTDET
jgi:hypothetical protein